MNFINGIPLITAILYAWACIVYADNGNHYGHQPPSDNNTTIIIEPYPYSTPETTNTTIEKVGCDGSALGVAAAQHQFDFGTHSWQWAAGAAYVDKNGEGCEALSLGIGKRIDRAVINGSISHESDSTAYGVGINGRF